MTSEIAESTTARRLGIDIWSDVMCPFCYLGDAHLARALEQWPHASSVDIRYHSFLLMPELPADAAIDLDELLATKRGMPREQARAMNAQFAERGTSVGLDYRMDRARATNMRRAHELTHFALEHGRQLDVVNRLFAAYFTDGTNIGDVDVLADLAEDVGLDPVAAREALRSNSYAQAVDDDIEQARRLGVTGVPFFVFDGTYGLSGAQPIETFLQVLDKVWDEGADSRTTR